MKNAELIAGLQKMQEGLSEVILALQSETTELPINPPTAKAEKKAETKTTAKVETPEPEETATTNFSKEELDSMTYNNLKKLAKELGVSAVGNRDEITARILGADVEVTATAPKEEEKKVDKKKTSSKGKVVPMKKEEKQPEPEEEPEEEGEETTEDETDEVRKNVEEATADMSNEEIADFLADAGLSPKGKREALIERLVQAVLDGTIDLEGEDEEADSNDADDSTEETEEDDINDLDNPNMTEERKQAIEDMEKEVRKQIKKKELTRDDMVEFIQQFFQTDEDMSDLSTEEIIVTYIDAVCRLIDDSGEIVEEGSYILNGEPACCGRHLEYDEDSNAFKCEVCETEYDAEEE